MNVFDESGVAVASAARSEAVDVVLKCPSVMDSSRELTK